MVSKQIIKSILKLTNILLRNVKKITFYLLVKILLRKTFRTSKSLQPSEDEIYL